MYNRCVCVFNCCFLFILCLVCCAHSRYCPCLCLYIHMSWRVVNFVLGGATSRISLFSRVHSKATLRSLNIAGRGANSAMRGVCSTELFRVMFAVNATHILCAYTAIIGRVAVGKMIRYRTTCACALLVYYVVSCKHSLYLYSLYHRHCETGKKWFFFHSFNLEKMVGRQALLVVVCCCWPWCCCSLPYIYIYIYMVLL